MVLTAPFYCEIYDNYNTLDVMINNIFMITMEQHSNNEKCQSEWQEGGPRLGEKI